MAKSRGRTSRVLLVAACLVAACASAGTTSPAASRPSTAELSASPVVPTTPPTGSPSQAPSGTWSGLTWSNPTFLGAWATPSDIVVWHGQYVVVGQVQDEATTRGAAWISADFQTWQRTLLEGPAAGTSSISTILVTAAGLVALGVSGIEHCASGEGGTCVPLPVVSWTSADGRNWQRAPAAATLKGATISGIVSSGAGIVAVGETTWNAPDIWISSDADVWTREPLLSAVFESAHFADIAVVPSGYIIVGWTGGGPPSCCAGDNDPARRPAAWISTDGRTWQAASFTDAGLTPGDELERVFVGANGLMAWGSIDDVPLWGSPDGRTWTATPLADASDPILVHAADGTRLIGTSYTGHNQIAFWTSSSGLAWQPLADLGAINEMPVWEGGGNVATANNEFVLPVALVAFGENGTTQSPMWLAPAVISR